MQPFFSPSLTLKACVRCSLFSFLFLRFPSPSLPSHLFTYTSLHSKALNSLPLGHSRTSVHIHARVFRVFALVYVLVRLVASQILANQPIIAYLFINLPLHFQRSIPSFSIVISYFYSVFFSFLSNLAPVSFRSFSSTYLFFHEFYRDHDSSAFR